MIDRREHVQESEVEKGQKWNSLGNIIQLHVIYSRNDFKSFGSHPCQCNPDLPDGKLERLT